MRYMVAELLFSIKKAWFENNMICLKNRLDLFLPDQIPRFDET